MQVRTHADCHAAAEVEHTVRRTVRRSAVGHIHRDSVLRLNRKRAGLRTQFSDFLLRADEHRNIAFQLVLHRVQLLHRQQDGGNARSVVKALAAKLTARQLDRLLREHDRRADANAAFGIEQTGVDRHLVDGDGLVLLTCFEQVRRHTGYHAVQRFVRENGHLTAEQHARVYTADRREPQKAAVQHLGNKKADLVEMCVQQDGFRALFTAGQAADHVAVLVRVHGVAVRPEQLRDGLCRLHFKAADRRQRAQRPQRLF